MTSLKNIYIQECEKYGCKKNSLLLKQLPDDVMNAGNLSELDLSENVIGPKGIRALFQVIANAPSLKKINLTNNGLTNEVISPLVDVLVTHPTAQELILDENPITTAAGKDLLNLTKTNPKIITLTLTGTIVRPLMTNCIGFQLDRNKRALNLPVDEFRTFSFGDDTSTQAFVMEDDTTKAREVLFAKTQVATDADEEEEQELKRRWSKSWGGGARRKTVSGMSIDRATASAFTARVIPKNQAESEWLLVTLANISLFAHLDDRELKTVADAMDKEVFKQGQWIYKQGDFNEDGDNFYVLQHGLCSEQTTGPHDTSKELHPGSSFGETELMYMSSRGSGIKVESTEVVVWALDRSTYCHMMTGMAQKKREKYYEFLTRVKFLKSLSHDERIQLADALEPHRCSDGSFLIQYGEEGQWCYIIVEGMIEVFGRDNNDKRIKVCDFGPSDCIGELEFINNHRCVADCIASGTVRAVKLNRHHFELCMGPVVDILKRTAQEDTKYEYYQSRMAGVEITANDSDPYAGFSFAGNDDRPGFSFGASSTKAEEIGGFSFGNATIECVEDKEEEFDQERAAQMLKRFSSGHLRRKTVSSEILKNDDIESFSPTVIPKSPSEMKTLQGTLEGNALFAHLEDRELQVALEAMRQVSVKKGDNVITQGEQTENADFYVVHYGRCTMIVDGEIKSTLREGDYFGEIELLYNQPRQATVRVDSETATLWALDRHTYRFIMTGTFMKKRRLYEKKLKHITFLKGLTHNELLQLADALQPAKYNVGDYLIQCGEEGKYMFILLEGRIEVLGRDDQGNNIKVCEFGPGDYVGELEFIYNHKTVADCKATTEVRAAKLNRSHFELCMGPIVDVLKRNASEDNTVYNYYNAQKKGVPIKASDSTDPYAGFSFGTNTNPDRTEDLVLEEAGDDVNDEEAEAIAQKFERGRRPTVTSEVFDAVAEEKTFIPKTYTKSVTDKNQLCATLSKNALFKHLDDREMAAAVDAFFPADFKAGDIVHQKGVHSTDQDTFHVIMQGEVAVKETDATVKAVLKTGETFGELELMFNQPRKCFIVARTNVKSFAVDRRTYKYILTGTFIRKRALYGDFLRAIRWLAGLSTPEILQLADALQPCNLPAGEVMIPYGAEGEWYYIIIEGTVEVIGRDTNNNKIKVCEFGAGDCVGELEFLNPAPTVADCIAVTEVRSARLNRAHFEMCMGPIKDLLKANREVDPVFDYYNHTRKHSTIRAQDSNDPTAGFTFGSPPTTPHGHLTVGGSQPVGGSLGDSFASDQMAAQYKQVSGTIRRKTVAAEVYDAEGDEQTYQPTVVEKSDEDAQWLNGVLKKLGIFSHLEPVELEVAIKAMEEVNFIYGEEIVTEGEDGTPEDMFYVIRDGEAAMAAAGKVIKTMTKGDFFGETDLMYQEPHRFGVKVTSPSGCKTWGLNRSNYQHIISGTFIRKRKLYEAFLHRVSWLKCMTHVELLQLADALEPCQLNDGDYLITYGEEGKWMYLIIEGTVKVVGRKDNQKVDVCTFTTGDCVGELEFINDHMCVADVVAVGAARAARLNRPHFEMCMGPVKDILKRNSSEENPVYDYYNQTANKTKTK